MGYLFYMNYVSFMIKLNKTERSVHMNRFDKIYVGIVILLAGTLFMSSRYVVKTIDADDAYAVVYRYDKEIQRYKMKDEGFYTVKGELGDVVIEIREGRVRVADEISPKNYCQTQGWVKSTNNPIICLPNGIKIELESNQITDDVDITIK